MCALLLLYAMLLVLPGLRTAACGFEGSLPESAQACITALWVRAACKKQCNTGGAGQQESSC